MLDRDFEAQAETYQPEPDLVDIWAEQIRFILARYCPACAGYNGYNHDDFHWINSITYDYDSDGTIVIEPIKLECVVPLFI